MRKKSFTSLVLVIVMLFSTFLVVTAQSDKNHGNKTANGWEVLGPGGGGLNVNPVVSPHDPNTVLLSCDMTGSYITHDGGESWRQFNLRTRVDAWGFDPVDKNTIYAGTTGLFRSTDNGDTWKLVFPDPTKVVAERAEKDFSGASFDVVDGYNWPDSSATSKLPWIHAVEVDPNNANQIYILLSNSDNINHLYYSGDKGATWVDTGVDAGMNVVRDTIISKIYFDPTSNDGTIYVVAYDGNIFKVKKTGETWSSTTIKPQGFIRDVAVGIDKSTNPATTAIYITETKNVGGSIILKSNDGGSTWAEITDGLNLVNKSTYVYRISTPYTDASVVYMTADNYVEPDGKLSWGVFKYTTAANKWESVLKNVGETYAENYSKGWNEQSFGPGWQGSPKFMNVAPGDSNIVYVSDMAMTYATKDGGNTWGQVYTNKVNEIDGVSSYRTRGIDVTTTYNIAFDPFDKKNMFVSYTDVGAFRSVDDGKSWIHSTKGIPQKVNNTCYWAEYDPEVQGKMWSVWASRHDLPRLSKYGSNAELSSSATSGGVYVSTDGGATWNTSGTGIPWNSAPTHILIDPTSSKDSRTLYVSVMGRGVYKSTDGGNTWSLKNSGLSSNLNAFRITRKEEGTLYLVVACGKGATAEPGDVYKSTDGAETWTKLSRPAGVYFPTDLVADPTDENHLYLSAWPATYNEPRRTTFGGVYESKDGGATWTEILNDSYHVYSLTIDYNADRISSKNDNNNKKDKFVLYATTHDCSVFRSEDGGKTWGRLSGANFRWNQRAFIDPHSSSKLYLTTFGGSVWYGNKKDTHTGVEDTYPIPYTTEGLEYPGIINN